MNFTFTTSRISKRERRLYVYVERVSGNLDPFTGIAGVTFDACPPLTSLAKAKDVNAMKTKLDISSFISEMIERVFSCLE